MGDSYGMNRNVLNSSEEERNLGILMSKD